MATNRGLEKLSDRLEALEGEVRELRSVLLPRQRLGLTLTQLRSKARKMSDAKQERTAVGLVRQVRSERPARASR